MSGDFDWAAHQREHERRRMEFDRLSLDPPSRIPAVGDRVLVAAGLVGRGFDWERLEAEVLEVADTAYRVRFRQKKYNGDNDEAWIHRFLVTDVLGKPAERAASDGQ